MRASILILPAVLALAACNSADRTAKDLQNAADTTGDALSNAAADVGNAASDAGDTISHGVEHLGNNLGNATADIVSHDSWVGRWKGVEGTHLTIAKGNEPGHYKLTMQYTLDDKGTFDGHSTIEGIAFTRSDGKQVLTASDGDSIGLKYLAGKKDCLKVKDGEGYCRD